MWRSYLQLSLNVLMVGFITYVLISFIQSVHSDIAVRVDAFSAGVWALWLRRADARRPLTAARACCRGHERDGSVQQELYRESLRARLLLLLLRVSSLCIALAVSSLCFVCTLAAPTSVATIVSLFCPLRSQPLPAMKQMCHAWETYVVPRASVCVVSTHRGVCVPGV